MKVMIEIPKEFECDLQDKFNEFFERVKCDINSSLESQEVSMCGNYERETAEMFLSAFEKATVIPDDATNGDMIKAMFGITDNDIDEGLSTTYVYTKTRVLKGGSQAHLRERITFNRDWWNAPYKKEVEEDD